MKDGDGTQAQDGLILVSGLLTDEFGFSTTPPSEQEIDQRTSAIINPSVSDVYRNLHQARAGAERAAAALQQFLLQPDSTADIAEMLSIAGYTYVYFAETFCSGVPFSRISGDSLIFGRPETTTETLDTALARFDSALAASPASQWTTERSPISRWSVAPGRCWISDSSRRRPPQRAWYRPSSSMRPSTPRVRSGCRTRSGRTLIRVSGRCRMWREAWDFLTSRRWIPGCRLIASMMMGTGSRILA